MATVKISDLARVFKVFRLIDETMPVQMLALFLAVAENEGASISDLREGVGMSAPSATRNIRALSNRHWISGKPGLGLVKTEEDALDTRRKNVTLTPKGHDLITELLTILNNKR